MQPEKKVVIRKRTPVSLPLKLAGMFALSFAFFFIALVGYELLAGFFQPSADLQAAVAKTSVPVDPKIAIDLERVLRMDTDTDVADMKDPFFDRAGLSGALVSTPGAVIASGGGVIQPAGTSVTTVSHPVGGNGGGSAVAAPAVLSAKDATRHRYEEWLRRGGNEPLDPRIFAVEDLLPVGIVDGGSTGQQVMFFSEAVNQTVSFPVGTLFFDGWLSELRTEGVVFSSNDERHTLRMRSWARSLKGTS